jgi:hypothetical protein
MGHETKSCHSSSKAGEYVVVHIITYKCKRCILMHLFIFLCNVIPHIIIIIIIVIMAVQPVLDLNCSFSLLSTLGEG